MMYFDNITLKAFIQENRNFFVNSRIQKIQQPTRREFVLFLRNNGQSKKFYININPEIYHTCFISKKTEEKRFITIPKKPPMFCMLLRKYLEGAKVVEITQPPYERILELHIETYNELSEKLNLCLAIELMGKHSNVILYREDNGLIIGSAHNVGSEKSRYREIRGNIPYIYPPKPNKRDFLSYCEAVNFDTMADEFLGITKPFAEMCRGLDSEKIKDFLELKNLSPVISYDMNEYSLFSELLNGNTQATVNDMIDNYFSYHQNKIILKELKNELNGQVNKNLKSIKNSLSKMELQLNKQKNYIKYKLYGDLIMANLYHLKDFQKEYILKDWNSNQDIIINLDETQTAKENANRFYKLYTKYKRSEESILRLKEKNISDIEYYENVLYSINIANDTEILSEIKSEIMHETNPVVKKISMPEEVDVFGFKVYIGKNNKQNDYIVSKLSKDNDMWFHSHNCPGSHVLLKLPNNEEVSDKLIFECAKLAKKYSTGANSSKVGIIYTKAKNLRKPPAANLGYVTYKNEQEIIID